MDYSDFSSSNFICDEFFQKWLIQPDEETNEFWNKWISEHPDKRATIEEAREFLLNIKFKENFPADEQIKKSLEKNLSVINALDEKSAKIFSIIRLKQIARIAAIFIFISFIGGGFYYYLNEKTILSTKYGEIKKIVLPDSSLVILNAHSTISYSKNGWSNRVRNVRLEGEAYFNIKHLNKDENNIKEGERFIVYTKDLNIEVLGTSFNVKKRTKSTEVILETGKIKVSYNNRDRPNSILIPGQVIAYDPINGPSIKSVNDPGIYTAWTKKELVLQDASVNEIVEYLEEIYGYKIILEDTAIGSKKMEGTLLLDDLQDVLFVLSNTLNVKIKRDGNKLYFKARK